MIVPEKVTILQPTGSGHWEPAVSQLSDGAATHLDGRSFHAPRGRLRLVVPSPSFRGVCPRRVKADGDARDAGAGAWRWDPITARPREGMALTTL